MRLPETVAPLHAHSCAPYTNGRVVAAFAALLCALPATATTARAQPRGAVASPGTSTNTSYVVEVTSFSMTPANPKAGDNVSFQLTLRNLGRTNASNVPWLVGLQGGSQMVGQGTLALAAGATQTVTATWRAVVGAQSAVGTVAPPGANTMINTATPMQKAKDLTFSVASVSASTVSEMETRLIEWERARVSGATFTTGRAAGVGCTAGAEPVPSDQYFVSSYPIQLIDRRGLVAVYVNCRQRPTGLRASPELFGNFALKNGWRVRSFDIQQIDPSMAQGVSGQSGAQGSYGWSVTQGSALNSDRPYTKLSVWADAGKLVLVVVRIEIQGPRGTDPYR